MEAQQTPVRTAIMRIMSEMLDSPDKDGIYETGRFMDKIEQLMCDMMAAPEVMQLSGSEAVFGLMAWLTTRKETTVIGPHQEVDISIIERFIESNSLKEPRELWHELLVHPPELEPELEPEVSQEFDSEGISGDDPIDFILEAGVDLGIIDIVGIEDPTILEELEDAEDTSPEFTIHGTLDEILAFIIKTGIHKPNKDKE